MGVIRDARKGAFQSTAYGLMTAAENKYMLNELGGNGRDFTSIYENNSLKEGENLDYKGTTPKEGVIAVMSGKVGLAITDGVWCAKKGYNDSKITIIKYEVETCILEDVPEIIDTEPPIISEITLDVTNVSENSFTIERSGNAIATHNDLATNPYIYQVSINNSAWISKCTNNTTSCNVIDLDEDTTYYYRICVQDKLGNENCTSSKTIKTDSGQFGTFTDTRDGYTYDTVKIGNQVWFAEDLRYDCSKDGYTNVKSGTSPWSASACGNQDTGYNAMLYGWVAAMKGSTTAGARGLCPVGWHIPSDDEWKILEGTVDSTYGVGHSEWDRNEAYRGSDAGTKLKDTSANGFGFKALLSGYRYTNGSFYNAGSGGYWWSSSVSGSSAYYRYLDSSNATVGRDTDSQADGFSVRCVRDL